MRRIAVLSACILVGGVVAPTTALATEDSGHDHGDQWIAVEDEFAVVLPDGTTFTGDDEGGEEDAVPPIGSQLFISEVLYEAEYDNARGDEVGRTFIQCTVQVLPENLMCDIAFVLDEGSQLLGSVLVNFAMADPDEPLQFDIPVTGGSGEYANATGVVSLTDISDPDDPEGETVTLYETELG